jgi:hypothetical protein
LALPTASYKERGHSDWSKRFGRWWRCVGGGSLHKDFDFRAALDGRYSPYCADPDGYCERQVWGEAV